jgi:hypothetical protein
LFSGRRKHIRVTRSVLAPPLALPRAIAYLRVPFLSDTPIETTPALF